MSARPAGADGNTVLVVDDDEDLREVMRRMLTRRGFTPLVAADAGQAMALFRDHAGGIDLLVTDLTMPEASGTELVRRATEILPGLPVLYVSGLPKDVAVQRGLIGPEAALIQKPFTADGLVAAVRAVLTGQPVD